MDIREILQRIMQQQQPPQPPPPQQQAPISDMDIQKMQGMMQQLNPDQLRMLQQELASQSAPAASSQQMRQGAGSGLSSLPNAFMQRSQQPQQNQVPQNALGLGYGVQR